MSVAIEAIFDDGVFKPVSPLDLPPNTRVRLVIESSENAKELDQVLAELDRLCQEFPVNSGGDRLTREQLHERR